MPLREIVQRAHAVCENYLEDVAIFLSEVAVTLHDQTTLTCECVFFSGGESNDDVTIQVDLKKRSVNGITVNSQLCGIFRRDPDEQKAMELKQKLVDLKEATYPFTPTLVDQLRVITQ